MSSKKNQNINYICLPIKQRLSEDLEYFDLAKKAAGELVPGH